MSTNDIPVEDIPKILSYGDKMQVFDPHNNNVRSFSYCCGSRYWPRTYGVGSRLTYIEASAYITKPVEVNPARTNHIIIADECMELLIEWDDV